MTLDDFLNRDDAPSMRQLAADAGVSYTTIKAVRKGMKLRLYDVAKKISEATGGQVRVEDLCEQAA